MQARGNGRGASVTPECYAYDLGGAAPRKNTILLRDVLLVAPPCTWRQGCSKHVGRARRGSAAAIVSRGCGVSAGGGVVIPRVSCMCAQHQQRLCWQLLTWNTTHRTFVYGRRWGHGHVLCLTHSFCVCIRCSDGVERALCSVCGGLIVWVARPRGPGRCRRARPFTRPAPRQGRRKAIGIGPPRSSGIPFP